MSVNREELQRWIDQMIGRLDLSMGKKLDASILSADSFRQTNTFWGNAARKDREFTQSRIDVCNDFMLEANSAGKEIS